MSEEVVDEIEIRDGIILLKCDHPRLGLHYHLEGRNKRRLFDRLIKGFDSIAKERGWFKVAYGNYQIKYVNSKNQTIVSLANLKRFGRWRIHVSPHLLDEDELIEVLEKIL